MYRENSDLKVDKETTGSASMRCTYLGAKTCQDNLRPFFWSVVPATGRTPAPLDALSFDAAYRHSFTGDSEVGDSSLGAAHTVLSSLLPTAVLGFRRVCNPVMEQSD